MAFSQATDVLKLETKMWQQTAEGHETLSIFMLQHWHGFLVHTWDKVLQEEPVLIATQTKGLTQVVSCFSLTLEYFWWTGAFSEAYPLFPCSWLLSKAATLTPTLGGPAASFGLSFFPVRPIASTSPLEENDALAHFFLFLEYIFFSGCYKLPSDGHQHYYFYRPEIGMQNLHPQY